MVLGRANMKMIELYRLANDSIKASWLQFWNMLSNMNIVDTAISMFFLK